MDLSDGFTHAKVMLRQHKSPRSEFPVARKALLLQQLVPLETDNRAGDRNGY